MNKILFKHVSVLLGFVALTAFLGNGSAQAETTSAPVIDEVDVVTAPAEEPSEPSETPALVSVEPQEVDQQDSVALEPAQEPQNLAAAQVSSSAEALTAETEEISAESTELAPVTESQDVALEGDLFGPRPSGIGGSALSYIGVGGNIGIVDEGESAVGEFGFAVISKIALSEVFSIRPGLIVSEEETTFVGPLTYDFGYLSLGRFQFAPYAGVGPSVGDDLNLLITGGVDYPISERFVGNAALNFSLIDEFDFGLTLGFGYKFKGPF